MNIRSTIFLAFLSFVSIGFGQHNNEFYNDGSLVHIQAGAEVHVWGDIHMYQASGDLENNGLIKMQGNAYSDNLFQQSGTGTFRVENSNVNVGERQFISGSYAVRGGQSQIGVNDGSFYNLELANSQGIVYLVGTGYIADVRNSVDFWAGTNQNRIYTHNIGLTGAITHPANGSDYTGIFGMMNPTAGVANFINNTATLNGNMSGVDNGYVQGKLRRAITAAGGSYHYPLGLEPAAAGAQRGFQYVQIIPAVNNYDVVLGYFQTGSDNSFAVQLECSGETMNYFGGVDHGEWMFSDITGSGTGTYQVQVWPQDDNYITAPVWSITKDNSFQGTANQCGPSPVALLRGGFNGFSLNPSEFNVAAPLSALPIELIDIRAEGIEDHITVTWNVGSESNVSHYELERSEDGMLFEHITNVAANGLLNTFQSYDYDDYDVRYFQLYYYRVKSVDFNGDYDYTPTVVASIHREMDGFDENSVSVYPNPSKDDFVLSILSNDNRVIQMNIYNVLGQIVQTKRLYVPEGNTAVKINAEEWAVGVYSIELRDSDSGKVINKRIIKQ